MVEFCSDEYLIKVKELSNKDEEFVKAAKDQNTTYTFIMEPEPEKGVNERITIGYRIENGVIKEIWRGERDTEFTISGRYGVWVDILKGKYGATKALLTRKLKARGNKIKLMRYANATKRWIEILRKIPTEFHGDYSKENIH